MKVTAVREVMERALRMGELGLQVAVWAEGELVIDEAAGVTAPGGAPVTTDTLFTVFSVTKAVVATALHIQAERGLVSYDSAVSDCWPEYAQRGKEATTVFDVLCHRAGIPQMPTGVTPELMCDWDWMISQIERLEPLYPPGTTNAYHELVWGWIVGEIVRRTDPRQRPLAQFIHDEICRPLGITDLFLGLPEEFLGRVAPVAAAQGPPPSHSEVFDLAMPSAVFPGPEVHNTELVRTGVHPGAGVIMNARSGARFFSLLCTGELDGVRLLSPQRIAGFLRPRPDAGEVDTVMGWVPWVGTGGYWLGGEAPPTYPVLAGTARALGHPGIGGSIGWADLDRHLGVAICHNWMQPDEVQGSYDPDVNPFIAIADAIRAAIDTS